MSRTLPRDLAAPVLDGPRAEHDPFHVADKADHARRHWPTDPDGDDLLDQLAREQHEIDVDARIRRRYAEPSRRTADCFAPGCVR